MNVFIIESNLVVGLSAGNWRRHGEERERGMPKTCRCGEASVIRTSGTAKNPGRLFYCCPMRSEGDKFHLFKWTDECMVEEIEDLKTMISELKGEMSDLKAVVLGYEKQIGELLESKAVFVGYEKHIEGLKNVVVECERGRNECISELRFFKNMMVCGIGMDVFYYYFVA